MSSPLEHMCKIYITIKGCFPEMNPKEICTQVDTWQKLEKIFLEFF